MNLTPEKLRDEIAITAMVELMRLKCGEEHGGPQVLVETAYAIADAMMKQREA